jgi:PST family polysaccharide transporter
MSGDQLRALDFHRALGLGAMQSLLRLALGFASIKVTAIAIGPSGLALIAQLNNFIGLCQGVFVTPATTAVIRLGSQYADQPDARRQMLATVFQLVLAGTLAFAAAAALSADWLAPALLAGQSHHGAVVLAAFAVPAAAFTNLVSAAFNSRGELGTVVRIQMLGAAAGFLIYVPSAYFLGIEGALLGASASYFAATVIAASIVRRKGAALWADIVSAPSREMMRRTLTFYPMLLVHAALVPLTLLIVRDQIVDHVGLEQAGLWQAGWRLSEIYLAILMAPFSMYFMPKLGALINNRPNFRREVRRTVRRAALLTLACAGSILLTREWVVLIVLAPRFAPVADLLPWQLAADVLAMVAWILSMTLTALMRSGPYVVCEIVRAAVLVCLARAMMPEHGVVAANWAYFAASAAHVSIAAIALRDILRGHGPAQRDP